MAQDENPSPSFEVQGIPCTIFVGEHGDQGGLAETWTDRGLEVRVEFLVRWFDRIPLIQALRGSAGPINGGVNIVRRDPWTLPMNPNEFMPDLDAYEDRPYAWDRYICVGTDTMRPLKLRTDQDGSVTGLKGWVYYEEVIIPARFAVAPYQIGDFNGTYALGQDLSGYPYTSVKAKASGEIFQAWFGTYKFLASSQPVGDAALIRPRQEFTITRYMLPSVDSDKYDALIGKVNDETIQIGTTQYAPESMLYMGYEPEWIGDPSTGLLFCHIHHTIMANALVKAPRGGGTNSSWNWALTKGGTFDEMVLTTDVLTNPYPRKAFKPVIWPEIA